MNNRGIVEAVFLVMEFEGVGTIEICIDKFTTTTMECFKLLVASNGELALSDTADIKVKGITLPCPLSMSPFLSAGEKDIPASLQALLLPCFMKI